MDEPRIQHLEALIREQTTLLNQQRVELAPRPQIHEHIRHRPSHFARWLLLRRFLAVFRFGTSRFSRGAQ